MAKVLLATSLGPGKEYAHKMLATVLASLCGVSEALLILDGIPFPRLETLPSSAVCVPVREAAGLTLIGRIARVREISRQYFLKTDCTHLYWHDSDMAPPADIIPRLLAHEAPVANGFYAIRGCDPENPWLPMMTRIWEDDGPHEVTVTMDQLVITDGIVRPIACGMGCMLVDRATMERTPFGPPESFVEGAYGEDIQWCLDSGESILIDTSIPVWHVDSDGSGVRPGVTF